MGVPQLELGLTRGGNGTKKIEFETAKVHPQKEPIMKKKNNV